MKGVTGDAVRGSRRVGKLLCRFAAFYDFDCLLDQIDQLVRRFVRRSNLLTAE